MYHLYHTPALVLASAPQGEGSKTFTLFTRELGLIHATATSVREERSKLRYGLQDFSYSEVTLVRGKEFWRVTSAVLIENVYTAFRATPEAALMFARAFRLLRRLVAGEEKNKRLFDAVREAFLFAKSSSIPPPFIKEATRSSEAENVSTLTKGVPPSWEVGVVKSLISPTTPVCDHPSSGRRGSPLPLEKGEFRPDVLAEVEIILVLRILYLLGYLAPRGEFGAVLSDISLWSDSLLFEARTFRSLALADINHSLWQTQL